MAKSPCLNVLGPEGCQRRKDRNPSGISAKILRRKEHLKCGSGLGTLQSLGGKYEHNLFREGKRTSPGWNPHQVGDRGSAGSLRKVVPILNASMGRLLGTFVCSWVSCHSMGKEAQGWGTQHRGRTLGMGEKKQRDGTGGLICVRFNKYPINYGWKGKGGDTKERKKGKVRIKKDQSSNYKE